MLPVRRWLAMGLVGAAMALGSGVQAGSNLEHGCLINFLQGRCDKCAQVAPTTPPAPCCVVRVCKTQYVGAETDDFVIYNHMWQKNTSELGSLGRYQLDLIARRLAAVPAPVVIETARDDKLDAARRDMVISLLGSRGFTDPKRVIVAYPSAESVHADDAAHGSSANTSTGH